MNRLKHYFMKIKRYINKFFQDIRSIYFVRQYTYSYCKYLAVSYQPLADSQM